MPRSVSAPGRPTQMTGSPQNVGRLTLAGGSTVSYLWILVGIELAATLILRGWSAGHHGG